MVLGITFSTFGMDFALLLLRLILAQIFILHGILKIKNPDPFARNFIPLGFFELISGILVGLGLFTEIAALLFVLIMLGAIYFKIFVWRNKTYPNNLEFEVIILITSLAVLILGPGSFRL